MSYRRKCKHCDRWISIRKMPGGQWVAFEGYDTIHDCKNPVTKKPSPGNQSSAINDADEKRSAYDDLSFPEIQVGTGNVPQRTVSGGSSSPPAARVMQRDLGRADQAHSPSIGKSSEGVPTWVWWVAALLVFLFLANN